MARFSIKATVHGSRQIRNLLYLTTCALCSAPGVAQSVTYGSPVVGGETTTQIGGITSSVPLLNILNPSGIATNKLGIYYITDGTGNAVYSVINPATPGFTPVYSKLNFTGLNSPTGVAVDQSGNVYVADCLNHRVVELPTNGTASQQTVPFTTTGDPVGVAVDRSGNLFVSVLFAPTAAGSVWKVTAGTHSATQIGSGFSQPKGLALDDAGNLFIADYNNARIVELSPAGSQQAVVNLTDFPSLVAVDSADNIFTDGGSDEYVVEVKAGTTGQIAVLPAILGIHNGLAVDGNDNLFAVSGPAPTLYESRTELIPLPAANVCQPGGNASTRCSSTVSLVFWIWNSVDLGTPRILTQGTSGLDFTDGGSSQNSSTQGIPQPCAAGQVTLVNGGSQMCSVTIKFAPLAAGPRSGAVQIVDSAGNVLVQLMLYGMGTGPQLSIAASGEAPITMPLPFNAGVETPNAIGVDAAGNVYVTEVVNGTSNYTSSVYKISPTGSQTTIPIANVFNPGRVEIDGAGDLFLPAAYADYEFPPNGSVTAPTPLLSNLRGGTNGLSLDGQGNVHMVSVNAGLGTGVIYQYTLDGSLTSIASSNNALLGDIVDDPWLSAVDTGGHFDAPIVAAGENLLEASTLEQGFLPFLNLQTLSTSFNIPQGSGLMGIGPGGDIYFANGYGIYDETGRTIFAASPGASGPFAVDGNGNFYIMEPPVGNAGASVVELPAIQQPFNFANTIVGSSSAAQVFAVSNRGNGQMSFTAISVSGPFALVPAKTTCSTAAPLAPGNSCEIGATFNPTAAGAAIGNLTIEVAGLVTPTFVLNGSGQSAPVPATTTIALTAPATTFTAGSTLILTATVESTGITPTGMVTFDDGTTAIGNTPLTGGVAKFSIGSLAAGQHSITASYAGDANNTGSISGSVSVTIAPISVQVVATSPISVAPGGSVTANVTVGSANNYFGTVSLSCSVIPQGQGVVADLPACAVNPASVTLVAGGSGTATLAVTTTAESARLEELSSSTIAVCGCSVGSILLLGFFFRRSRVGAVLAFVVLAHLTIIGCNTKNPPPAVGTSSPGTAAGTYLITLISTAGQVTTTQTFTMTVQ